MTNTASTEGLLDEIDELLIVVALGPKLAKIYRDSDKRTLLSDEQYVNLRAAINRYAATMAREELERLKFHGQGSEKQTLAAIYTHVLLRKQELAALASPDGEMKGKSE